MRERMGWRSVTFDWNRARAFLVTAEEGSLSAAARALGMSQPTLGRQVSALERELGVALFERVGRGLALTEGGVGLLEHVRSMGQAARSVSLAASGQSHDLVGTITLTASEVVSAFLLPPVLQQLRATHPGLTVRLVASNAVHDLRRREADIAIRNGRPKDPALIATRVRDVPARLYATPEYLARLGSPASPAELRGADFIGFGDDGFMDGLNGLGFDLTAKSFPLHSTNHMVLWELVKHGLGIGSILEEVGDVEPLVQRVFPDMAAIPVPTWLVSHREVHSSRRVRMVFDLLAEHFAPPRRRARTAASGPDVATVPRTR